MDDVKTVSQALGFAIDHQVDRALGPARDVFASMPRSGLEAEGTEHRAQGVGFLVAGGEFDELDAARDDARRNGGRRDRAGDSPLEHPQRAVPVARDPSCRTGAEPVVEDLQAPVALVADPPDGVGPVIEGEVALSRHRAEMPAPAEVIHVQHRRVRDLDDEQFLGADVPDAAGRDLAGERMEAVEDEPDAGMVGIADQRPGVAVVVDVAAPGEGFIADPQLACGGALSGLLQVADHPGAVVVRQRRATRADQQQVGPKLCHDVELAFQPVESACALWPGQTLEVAEGLEQCAGEPEVDHHRADLARAEID